MDSAIFFKTLKEFDQYIPLVYTCSSGISFIQAMINKFATIAFLLTLSGCANVTPPVDVSTIPNDCANQARIIAWLTSMANQPQQVLETDANYEATRRSYRARIWHLKSRCNPA